VFDSVNHDSCYDRKRPLHLLLLRIWPDGEARGEAGEKSYVYQAHGIALQEVPPPRGYEGQQIYKRLGFLYGLERFGLYKKDDEGDSDEPGPILVKPDVKLQTFKII
jgi:hypothetical protein